MSPHRDTSVFRAVAGWAQVAGLAAGLALATGAVAQELRSDSFILRAPTFSGGGGIDLESTPSGVFRAQGVTIGESSPLGHSVGPTSGVTLDTGFWPVVAAAATPNDSDEDGVPDVTDNCVDVPNGPGGGTCTRGSGVGGGCAGDVDCGDAGFCSLAQEDGDVDGSGDACECGDFTGDGVVDSADARMVQRCAVGLVACVGLCDADGDGACTSNDARRIQRFAVGLVVKDDLTCDARP